MRQAGFTLLEILVALAVLGFLMVGLGEGVRFGVRAWDNETRLVAGHADMDAVERVLRALVTQADPGQPSEPSGFSGAARTMSFLTRLPMTTPGLTRDAQVTLGVDQKHRLVLRWLAHPHAERLTPAPPASETVLIEGVDHLELRYQRTAAQGGGWVTAWTFPTLPELVDIRLAFAKSDRRHWPDIVTAPMRGRLEE